MERITLKIFIPLATALAYASPESGNITYSPTRAELATLTEDERAFVAARSTHTFNVLSLPVCWESVHAAIKLEITRAKAKAEEERLKLEKRVLEWLALTDDELLVKHVHSTSVNWTLSHVSLDMLNDARVSERRERLLRIAEARSITDTAAMHAEYNATPVGNLVRFNSSTCELEVINDVWSGIPATADHYQEALRHARDKTRARVEKRQRALREYNDFALLLPALERGVREGYDMSGAVVEHLLTELTSPFEGLYVLKVGTPEYDDATWDKRNSPSAKAFELYDRVKAHVESVKVPDSVSATVHEIVRFCPNEDNQCSTRVIVTLDVPFVASYVLAYLAE